MQFALLCFCTVTLIVPTEQMSRIDLYLMWHAYYWILSLSIICSWCNVLTNIPPAGWLRGTGVYITMNIIIQCNCPQSPSNNCLLSSTSHQLLLFVMEGEGETDHMLLIFYWDSLYVLMCSIRKIFLPKGRVQKKKKEMEISLLGGVVVSEAGQFPKKKVFYAPKELKITLKA